MISPVLALSRVTSGQSIMTNLRRVGSGEIDAFRRHFGILSRTLSMSFTFISELYASQILSDDQMDYYLKKFARLRDDGKEWSEQNCEILFEIKKKISERPDMFYEFCKVLVRLDYGDCSKKLKGIYD